MNKLFAIAFMCIYLLLSVGVVKTTHYCMGREKSTKIFSFEAKKCPCSLFLPEKNDCCHDSSEILILDDFQAQTLVFAPSIPVYFELGEIHPILANIEVIAKPITQYINPEFSPPPKEPLYRIHCSLVLYDEELS